MNQFNNLDGKVALVTGAIGQLGNKFIHSLAENGASVCITDKNLSLCKKKIKFLPSNKFLNHTAISLDVTSEKAANDAVKFVKKTYDKIDDVLTKSILDNEMNFLEIGMIMMMLDEKMLQNKTALYMQYSSSLDENTTSNVKIEGADTNMYK